MGKTKYIVILLAFVLTPLVSQSKTHKASEAQADCNCSTKSDAVSKLGGDLKKISSKVHEDNDDLNISGYKTCDGSQKGIASVYGIRGRDNFAGKRTASGEIMRPEKLRAAILRSAGQQYPLGTWVKVSNGDRSVMVCINDTGGGKSGRVIDLSSAASRAIGNGDLGRVEVECIIKPVKGRKMCDDKVASQIRDE